MSDLFNNDNSWDSMSPEQQKILIEKEQNLPKLVKKLEIIKKIAEQLKPIEKQFNEEIEAIVSREIPTEKGSLQIGDIQITKDQKVTYKVQAQKDLVKKIDGQLDDYIEQAKQAVANGADPKLLDDVQAKINDYKKNITENTKTTLASPAKRIKELEELQNSLSNFGIKTSPDGFISNVKAGKEPEGDIVKNTPETPFQKEIKTVITTKVPKNSILIPENLVERVITMIDGDLNANTSVNGKAQAMVQFLLGGLPKDFVPEDPFADKAGVVDENEYYNNNNNSKDDGKDK